MNRKRLTGIRAMAAVALVALVGSGMAACGSNSNSTAQSAIFSVNGGEPTRGLIPAKADDQDGIKVLDLLFSGLVTYDQKGTVVNEVAKEITPSADFKTWTITLNEDRKFSDGTSVKAENFTRAWIQSAAQELGSTSAFAPIEGAKEDGTGDLTGVSPQGDWKIEIKLSQPVSDFDTRLGINGFYPLPDSAFDSEGKIQDDFGQNPIGNGPYTLENWQHNQELQLRKSKTYTGVREAQNDGINIKILSESSAGYNGLLGGDLDVFDDIAASNLKTWEQDLGDRRLSSEAANAQTVDIDYNTPHFSGEEGKLRRQAISQAINREEIVNTIFNGSRSVATDFLPQNIAGHTDSLSNESRLQYNPDAAKQAWDQANQISQWEGDLPIAYNSDADHRAWVEAVANQLKNALGVNAVGEPVSSFKEMMERMDQHDFRGPFRMGWTLGYPSAANLFAGRFILGGGGDKSCYDNADFNKLIDQAMSASGDEQLNYYKQAQELLAEDLPVIPLWTLKKNIGYSKNVSNVTADWKGDVALEKVKVNS